MPDVPPAQAGAQPALQPVRRVRGQGRPPLHLAERVRRAQQLRLLPRAARLAEPAVRLRHLPRAPHPHGAAAGAPRRANNVDDGDWLGAAVDDGPVVAALARPVGLGGAAAVADRVGGAADADELAARDGPARLPRLPAVGGRDDERERQVGRPGRGRRGRAGVEGAADRRAGGRGEGTTGTGVAVADQGPVGRGSFEAGGDADDAGDEWAVEDGRGCQWWQCGTGATGRAVG